MDLLATVRKEGSRGGRGDFKWSDVQGSSHRENYLGHSVMAPVGRWQKGRDLNWYSKADDEGDGDAAERAAREKKEELRRIKEAEQDAMARALGLPVPDRSNANLEQVSDKRDITRVLNDAIDNDAETSSRGVGFDAFRSGGGSAQILGERIEGNAEAQDQELEYALKEYKRRHREDGHRRRSRSPRRDHVDQHRSRHRDRDHRHRHRRDQPRSRSRERAHRRRSRSRSRSRERRDRKDGRRDDRSSYRRDEGRAERTDRD